MAEHTRIEWTDATWNPITGCTLVSEGCRHCYAARLAATRLRDHPSRKGLARINAAGEAKFTGEVRLNEDWLDQPLRWRRARRIFVCAHGDLFQENVPDDWIDRVFAIMAMAPQHTFQVLTKRPMRARDHLRALAGLTGMARLMAAAEQVDHPRAQDVQTKWPLPNVWLGTSVEDQPTADARIPHLLAAPAALRFVSAEPLLGPVDLSSLRTEKGTLRPYAASVDALAGACQSLDHTSNDWFRLPAMIDWVIVGGESGPQARPMHPDWARDLRDQCQTTGVPFFFKQWGAWAPFAQVATETTYHDAMQPGPTPDGWHEWCAPFRAGFSVRVSKTRAGRLLDGREWNEMPTP